jgi:preprotein translocase SecF subunit
MRFFELVPPGTKIDFIGRWRLWVTISAAVIGVSLAAIPVRGIRLGIDFAGGTEMLVRFAPGASADEGALRTVLSSCGIPEPNVIRYGEAEAEFLVRFGALEDPGAVAAAVERGECPVSPEQRSSLAALLEAQGDSVKGAVVDQLTFALQNAIGQLSIERVDYVGPKVGEDLRRDGIYAIAIACLLILVYVGFRFSPRYAPGAVVALVHDVAITAGFFVLLGLEFDLRVLAALLAVLGYSLNDTIVVYDRIRENLALHTKYDLAEVLNRSVNETLSRTLLTGSTTLLALVALLLLGGEVVRPFAIAMTIGILVGTYSSIYIAAPTLLWLEGRRSGREQRPAQPPQAATPTGRGKRARA